VLINTLSAAEAAPCQSAAFGLGTAIVCERVWLDLGAAYAVGMSSGGGTVMASTVKPSTVKAGPVQIGSVQDSNFQHNSMQAIRLRPLSGGEVGPLPARERGPA
jgi:hypothetical protein